MQLVQEEPLVRRLRSLLPPIDRERADRFQRAGAAERWTVSRAALRILLCARLGCIPEDLQIEVTEHGKPYLPGSPLHFNLSHSGDRALIALSEACEVGVDIERPGRNVRAVERTLSDGERATGDDLLQVWCRKEAWAKALGGGLGWSPERFDTTRTNGFALADLPLDGGYRGALAVEGADASHALRKLSL
ncbi:4'-phosphopantetheinyl transferase [Solirubrobacter pauli]|uniref:4'-phosphopantetheinyl transferase n=1 Tax=Solirubrobacter pauli TaxID=166793 RepID=A0A660L9A8_9ACTN|nr:4'-phosphopantetheinyl transferase superfamily protein [Solirubrobacter pauli]RKQ88140.1 4'-phosphopantetheinyl transferase [Solirubrobacter pauli]